VPKAKNKRMIPEFASEEEERDFWSSHDSTEYLDWRKAERVKLPNLENILIARSPRFQAVLNNSRQSIQAGKGLPEKDFWKAVALRGKKSKANSTSP